MNAHEEPTGAVQFSYPTCGRREVVQFPEPGRPYKRIVEDNGDPTAQHSGGIGGAEIASPTPGGREVQRPEASDDTNDFSGDVPTEFTDFFSGRG